MKIIFSIVYLFIWCITGSSWALEPDGASKKIGSLQKRARKALLAKLDVLRSDEILDYFYDKKLGVHKRSYGTRLPTAVAVDFAIFAFFNSAGHNTKNIQAYADYLLKSGLMSEGEEKLVSFLRNSMQNGRLIPGLFVKALDQSNNAVMDFLLEHRLLLEDKTSSGFSPLHAAVSADREDVVAHLLSARVNPNVIDAQEITPLHYAKSIPVAKLLLDAGAFIDWQDPVRKHDAVHSIFSAGFIDTAHYVHDIRQMQLNLQDGFF